MRRKKLAVVQHNPTAEIQTADPRIQDPRIQDPRIQLAVTLLQKNALAPDIRIKEIAARLHISRSHLRHLFTKEVGMAPMLYVRVLRLRRAHELLETTFLSVKEIMAAVGFSDFSHFVRNYKQQFGKTPSQTRVSTRIA